MGFTNPPPPILFDDPHTQMAPQISPHIHQKRRKGCRNDYIEAFGAFYWAKKLFKENLRGLRQPLFGGRGLIYFVEVNDSQS